MQVSHTARAVTAAFDDTNLVSVAGLVPLMKLAEKAVLRKLADTWLSVPTDKGAHAGLKVASRFLINLATGVRARQHLVGRPARGETHHREVHSRRGNATSRRPVWRHRQCVQRSARAGKPAGKPRQHAR